MRVDRWDVLPSEVTGAVGLAQHVIAVKRTLRQLAAKAIHGLQVHEARVVRQHLVGDLRGLRAVQDSSETRQVLSPPTRRLPGLIPTFSCIAGLWPYHTPAQRRC